jgi:hypothetical protein
VVVKKMESRRQEMSLEQRVSCRFVSTWRKTKQIGRNILSKQIYHQYQEISERGKPLK